MAYSAPRCRLGSSRFAVLLWLSSVLGGMAAAYLTPLVPERGPSGPMQQLAQRDSRRTAAAAVEAPPEAGIAWPPGVLKGIYLSFRSASSERGVGAATKLAANGLINAVAIDVKDILGRVGYDIRVPEAAGHGARPRMIADLNALVCTLREAGLYEIARMAVFKDAKLAEARPQVGIRSRRAQPAVGPPFLSGGALWRDKRQQAGLDPAAVDEWACNAAIAAEDFRAGVDEVNRDYIRFPTDGDLHDMHFAVRRAATSRREVLCAFFAYFRRKFPDQCLSADPRGLVSVARDDLGIGQVLEDAAPYFDFLCPMVYPSHYARGFRGFRKPAEHPCDVVQHPLAAKALVAGFRSRDALRRRDGRGAARSDPRSPGARRTGPFCCGTRGTRTPPRPCGSAMGGSSHDAVIEPSRNSSANGGSLLTLSLRLLLARPEGGWE